MDGAREPAGAPGRDPGYETDLAQEKRADYRVYEITGPPDDLGRQMASRRPDLGGPPLESLTPEQVDFARACAAVLAREYPAALAEVEAMAAAYGRPVEEAYWFLSVGLTEAPARGLVTSRRRRMGKARAADPADEADEGRGDPDPAPPGCSTVAVLTADGPVVGRNYDFFYWATTRHLITTRPAPPPGPPEAATPPPQPARWPDRGGPLAHVGMYDGLLAGRHDGMNEAGLFASLHGVRSAPPARRRPGLFSVLVVRIVLETCRTAREAVERIRSLPHLASYNYLVADDREVFVVEAHPERTRVREAENGVLAATNHFRHPDMVGLGRKAPSGSVARYRFLSETAARLRPASAETVAGLMRDHKTPVCGHADGMATFWSAVALPAARRVSYCLGAPCRNDYTHTTVW